MTSSVGGSSTSGKFFNKDGVTLFGTTIPFNKRTGIYALVAVAVLALIIGLSVGLTQGDDDSNDNEGAGTSTVTTISTTTTPAPDSNPIRLPEDLKPIHYEIKLQPLINGNFSILGSEVIEIEALAATNKIVLHMAEITAKEETVTLKVGSLDGREIKILSHNYSVEYEYYTTELEEILETGEKYFLSMDFTAFLNNDLRGFYRSVYTNEMGEDVYIATSQFEPTDARRAFPCFDEPQLKATFSISIARETNMIAVSNMPIGSTVDVPDQAGWVWDIFNETVPMSTYLVAFVVSDFVFNGTVTDNGIEFNIYARSGAINLTGYALGHGSKVITFFENYFDVPYPLPKQDMFAIPDFSAGAMENWGLITYRESRLLYDPSVSSASIKESIGEVVAHELAHQWFGNLVTMTWWTELWLNEGFATFMSYIALEATEEGFAMGDQFVYVEMHTVMAIDCLSSSHPINIVVNSPDEINEIFDVISYNKGASVLRMMMTFLSESTFQKALTNYLKDRAYGSATQDDLWSAMTTQAHIDGTLDASLTVKEIMDTWTLQAGYPVITVTKSDDGTKYLVKQSKFSLVTNEIRNGEKEETFKWWVPISLTTQTEKDFSNAAPKYWIDKNSEELEIPVTPTDDWVLFNLLETGYYRVNYEEDNWLRLIQQLKETHKDIAVTNRAQILDDSFNLARYGHLTYEIPLSASGYLVNERNYVPWVTGLYSMGFVESMFSRTDDYDLLKRYMIDLMTPAHIEMIDNYDNGLADHLGEKLLSLLNEWECHLEDTQCMQGAFGIFSEWIDDGSADEIFPPYKSATYCSGIAQGTTENWEFTFNVSLYTNYASERNLLLDGLGCSKDTEILENYLDMAFNESSGIRKQDTSRVFNAVARNDIGRDIAWAYTKENFEKMAAYTSSFNAAAEFVETVTYEFNTQEELNELLEFKERYADELSSADRLIDQAVERVNANIQWMTQNYDFIANWLREEQNNAGDTTTEPTTTPAPDSTNEPTTTPAPDSTNELTTTPAPDSNPIRLPEDLKPIHYDIKLQPLINGNFSILGSEVIEFEALATTNKIVLHMAEITAKEETVTLKVGSIDGREIKILNHDYSVEYEYHTTELDETLQTGEKYYLSMDFTAFLNNDLRGFYRSVYTNEMGEDVYIATSQFEPTDARRAFACFDEPQLKATFSISIARETNMIAVSNMPVESTVDVPDQAGWVWDIFSKTVPMSTYLVAFVVSDFVSNGTVTDNGIEFNIYARSGAINLTDYALGHGSKVITFFENYFDVPYPLPKQDMFAIPDFSAGAMENWGLITYRESRLLYDPSVSSASIKESIGEVVAHELAHQWFGNLVTMTWWTELWLNEGFATFMSYIALEATEEGFAMGDQFVYVEMHTVMAIDCLSSSHPINVDVNTPDEINEIFDVISYNKGASVLRMMMTFLSENTFQKALTNYLKDRAYGSATQDDLWSAMTTQAHTDGTLDASLTVKEIMDTWTLQVGYPVITVTKSDDGTKYLVKQSKFSLVTNEIRNEDKEETFKWWVPISLTTQTEKDFSNAAPKYWIDKNSEELEIPVTPSDDWVLFNLLETGYYRVNYEEDNWLRLIQQLKETHKDIAVTNRAQILDDSFNLCRYGHLTYEIPLSASGYLVDERNYVPWVTGLYSMGFVESMFSRTDDYDLLKRYMIDLMTPAYIEMIDNYDNGLADHLEEKLLSLLNEWECHLELSNCMQGAFGIFSEWVEDGSADEIFPPYKSATYCSGIAQGTTENWDFTFNVSLYTNYASERNLLLDGLGCSKDTEILENYLDMAFNESSGIRKQDTSRVFNAVARNDIGRDIAWAYTKENFEKMAAYTSSFNAAAEFVETVTYEFNTQDELNELLEFKERYADVLSSADRLIDQAVERVNANIQWMTQNYDFIANWLREENPDFYVTDDSSRLPTSLTPLHYNLELLVNKNMKDNPEFEGTVSIEVEVAEETNLVVLHSSNLTIISSSISGDSPVIIITEHHNSVNDFYTLELSRTLAVNENVNLAFRFDGYLNDQLRGFYRSVYTNELNEDVYLAMTQFAPTDARMAFPCFDEPQLKATFGISLRRDESMTTRSNMPFKQTVVRDNVLYDEFETSVKMSTYLVAFIVSDFSYNSTDIDNGRVEYEVMAREAAMPQTQYALEVGPNILQYYENYFSYPYPLPKMDMAAVPDFAAGAMENWGLITYRETAMLYDPELSTAANKQRVCVVVAHELAHQWFGNLVTPEWWNEIWLNEGFASYHEFLGTAYHEPTWKMEYQFLVEDLHPVFATDSLLNSHPLNMEVNTTAQITALFDTISYSKGASILRMIKHFLTEETFQKGLSKYLSEIAYGSSTQNILWSYLEAQAEEDGIVLEASMDTIMNTWTTQAGYPVLKVERTTGSQVEITQKRFLNDGSDGPERWWVPISYTSESLSDFNSTNPSIWFKPEDTQLTVDIGGADEWIIINIMQTGYYRVNYDDANWQLLIQQLTSDHTVIHEVNRAQLIDDSLELSKTGMLSYAISLELTTYLSKETEYVPWETALSNLGYLERMFSTKDGYVFMKAYLLSLMTPIYTSVGFEDSLEDPHLVQRQRASISSWVCHLDYNDCVINAVAEFDQWLASGGQLTAVSPNSKYTTYCTGIADVDQAKWDSIWDIYEATGLATEKNTLLQALGCSKDPSILTNYLDMAFSPDSGIKKQDINTVFGSISGNDEGRDLAWDYLRTNWDYIAEYCDAFTTLEGLISSATAEFNTDEQLQELNDFQSTNADNLGSAERAVEQAIEKTTANIQWMDSYYDIILDNINDYLIKNIQKDTLDYRLPETLKPLHYKVMLKPFIQEDNFNVSGMVEIEMEVMESTSTIVLHMADIITHNDTIKLLHGNTSDDTQSFLMHEYDATLEYYIGYLVEPLEVGEVYTLSMEFTGYLNDQLRGFYRSVYYDENDAKKYIATTQFQPTDARRAFPCFDEPGMKATFSISIARESDSLMTVSNMPLKETTTVNGWEWDEFEETLPMSTYLIAFVVSDFVFIENTTVNGILYKVYARSEGIDDAAFALGIGSDAITFYENYFSIPYPLPKQDMFAIPDFALGAMENWGLITYRESALLYSFTMSTATSKQRVGSIVSHELAHQWFGNLVTMYWWTDLWLNEGFASYMENVALDSIYPEWNMLGQFVCNDMHLVFELDALNSSHPISVPVENPSQINEIFDAISYSKGAAIIRMMKHFLTENTFRSGLTNYLNDRAYSSATQDDLWSALTTQAHLDGTLDASLTVKEIMDTWTLQMGYPVVNVESNKTDDSISYTFAQERFFLIPENSDMDDDYSWWVPVNYFTNLDADSQDSTTPTQWITPDSSVQVDETVLPGFQWIIVNTKETGYYRVNYEKVNWDALTTQLNTDHTKINLINRAQLIDDSLNLARAGLLNYDTPLSLNQYLMNERDYVPWTSAKRNLDYLESMFTRQADYDLMKDYLLKLLLPTYTEVGFEDSPSDPHLTNLLRSSITKWTCHFENPDCVNNAKTSFDLWISTNGNETSVMPNLKGTVYCTGIAEGSSSDWDTAFDIAVNSNLASERDLLLTSLGCSKDPEILKNYLDLAFDETSGIRKQDSDRVFTAVAFNDVGRDIAWEYLKENFTQMALYSGSFTTAGDYVEDVTYEFNTQQELDELLAFKTTYEDSLGSATRAVDQSIERVGANIEWMSKNYAYIVTWLQNFNIPDETTTL